jgi:hypothetical protein
MPTTMGPPTSPTADAAGPQQGQQQQQTSVISKPKNISTSSTALARYQHYGQELALFLLQHGQDSLQMYLRFLLRASSCLRLWLQENQQHVVLASIVRALRWLRLKLLAPIGQLLCGLLSLQLRISTNDDLDDATKLSARINSCVTLLFGAVRWVQKFKGSRAAGQACWALLTMSQTSLVLTHLADLSWCSSTCLQKGRIKIIFEAPQRVDVAENAAS